MLHLDNMYILCTFSFWLQYHTYQFNDQIKTHGSESQGQEEAGLCDKRARSSELFTGSTAVKLANALNKPP